jgi:prepilin-type processing-associated H-X9-DG protein
LSAGRRGQIDVMMSARRVGFTLPELVVVIGLAMLLVGMLLPSISRARRQAQSIVCRAQLQQLGTALTVYANENRGHLYPFRGWPPVGPTWREILFDEPDPAVLICPTGEGEETLSYQLSFWIMFGRIGAHGGNAKGVPASRIVLAGESWRGRMYEFSFVDPETHATSWDPARHGPGLMSNFLWLDLHVDNVAPPPAVPPDYDPWYVPSR